MPSALLKRLGLDRLRVARPATSAPNPTAVAGPPPTDVNVTPGVAAPIVPAAAAPAIPIEMAMWKAWDERQPGAASPAKVQHAPLPQLPSVDDLQELVGHAPHPDRFGGRWPMSVQYKLLHAELGSAQKRIIEMKARPLPDLMTNRSDVENEMIRQMDSLTAAATAYDQSLRGEGKQRVAPEIAARAGTFKSELTAVIDQITLDPDFASIAPHITIGAAMLLKARGISFADCSCSTQNDETLDRLRSRERFDSGAVASVSLLTHQDGVARIFKPEPHTDPRPKRCAREMGIDPSAPHFGNRNIASRAVADMLAVDVIPHAQFVLHDGEVGVLMSKAPGRSPRVKVWSEVDDQEWAEREPVFNHRNLRLEKQNGRWMKYDEVVTQPWDADRPPSPTALANLQKGLNQLEWTDMLTGQADRHSANYFVDISGDKVKVTGIDNDFAFGKEQTGLLQYNPNIGVTSPGEPTLIDRAIYYRLITADFDRDMVPVLEGRLSEDEIEASRQRFNAVVGLAHQLQAAGCVVGDWETWRSQDLPPKTAADFLKTAATPSLFKRDIAR
jgi:hypothetical protein